MPKSYTVDDDFKESRLDKWFKINVINLPHSLIEKIIRQNKIKVNKRKTKSSYRLKSGDLIEIYDISKLKPIDNKKRLFSKLQDKTSVTKVFSELSKRYSSRKGGYSRVLKAGFRTGDDAPMAVIELVDRNPEAKKIDKPKKKETKDKNKEVQTEPKLAKK